MGEEHLLVLSVKSGAQDACPFDLAVVTVDARLCRLVVARHAQIAIIFQQHPELGLYGAEFWDDRCSWVGDPDNSFRADESLSSLADDEDAEDVLQELRQAVESSMSEYVFLEDKCLSDLPQSIQHGCQCACMVVKGDGIHWNALPKNENYQVETATVPVDRFTAFLRQFERCSSTIELSPNHEKGG